jgi:oligopeptide/dipeptide ABC transporter ATP-binding protein
MTAIAPLLDVRGLRTYFSSQGKITKAVDGVSYTVNPGETVAVVGESGSGKSAHARSIIRLVPGSGRVVAGEVLYKGRDLLKLSDREMRKVRGAEIGMVFQEPMNSLNPVLTIGSQITETVHAHLGLSHADARDRAVELLRRVRLPDPVRHLGEYPHQLSGGMCQRVMLAIAMAAEPALLIADEPTTALDVTVQAQILDLIAELSSELHMATVLITHDLGIVARYADKVIVMYAGRVVEQAPTRELFKNPGHPYTADLLNSLPRMHERGPKRRLQPIRGNPPNVQNLPPGCSYAPRCGHATDLCFHEAPPVATLGAGRSAACWLAKELQPHDLEKSDIA